MGAAHIAQVQTIGATARVEKACEACIERAATFPNRSQRRCRLAYMLPKRKLRRKAVLSDFCSYWHVSPIHLVRQEEEEEEDVHQFVSSSLHAQEESSPIPRRADAKARVFSRGVGLLHARPVVARRVCRAVCTNKA